MRSLKNSDNIKMLTGLLNGQESPHSSVMIKGFSGKIPNVTHGHHTNLVNFVCVRYKELKFSYYYYLLIELNALINVSELSRLKIVRSRKFCLLACTKCSFRH